MVRVRGGGECEGGFKEAATVIAGMWKENDDDCLDVTAWRLYGVRWVFRGW